MRCAYCGLPRPRFWADGKGFCDEACHVKWKGRFDRGVNKPSGCPVRRAEPKGPIELCKNTCLVFEACVEHTRNERDFEAFQMKELERMRESLNPVRAS